MPAESTQCYERMANDESRDEATLVSIRLEDAECPGTDGNSPHVPGAVSCPVAAVTVADPEGRCSN